MKQRRPKSPMTFLRRSSVGRTPTAIRDRTLEIIEVPSWPAIDFLLNETNSYLRTYRIGECSVIVTREYDRWHLSIAHLKRPPTWDEIAFARYNILPRDITAAMVLPPLESYVNVHEYCFQVVEIIDPGLKRL
jgi:hypothetical protein